MRLLVQIRDCADQFTFPFFVEQFPIDPSYVNWQSGAFALFSEDGMTVSTVIINKDIDDLKVLTAQRRNWPTGHLHILISEVSTV